MSVSASRKFLWHWAVATTLFVLATLLMLGATPAQAQTSKQSAERAREADRQANIERTTKILTADKIPCVVIDAAEKGQVEAEMEGKTINIDVHEVVCEDKRGYFLFSYKNRLTEKPVSCNALEAEKAVNGNGDVCNLRDNRTPFLWLRPLVEAKTPGCTVSGARWIAPNEGGDKTFYEVSCKEGQGGIYLVPDDIANTQLSFISCLKSEGTPLACTTVTHAGAVAALRTAAKQAVPDCVISDARYVGQSKGNDVFEIACGPQPGFVLVLDQEGAQQALASCAEAAGIGGCKLTDMAQVDAAAQAKAAEAKAKYQTHYLAALTAGGVTCTNPDFVRHGRDGGSRRDLAEFRCDETPAGLVALIPDEGATSKLETFDCFTARLEKITCELTTDMALTNHLQRLTANHKSIAVDCQISEVRYAFENNGQIVLEIACANKKGYIAVLNQARTALNPAVRCHVAATSASVPEKCTIEGNGSNQS